MSTRQRTTVIRSSGSYLPPQIVTNEMLSRIMDTTDEWIVPRTGIRERRFVVPGVGPAELAEQAARNALEKASLTPADIDLVVFATMTPDHYFPGKRRPPRGAARNVDDARSGHSYAVRRIPFRPAYGRRLHPLGDL